MARKIPSIDETTKALTPEVVAANSGTTAQTFAGGADTRITGAAQKAANLSDLADPATARANLGLGTAATTAATAYATAAQGELADATTVQQVTLTAPLAYTLPVSVPAGIVHRVTFTQDGAGGHTVTYDGAPVTVDLTAGASTTVEFHPVGAGHATRYPVTNLDAQVSALAEDGGSALGASLSSTFVRVLTLGADAAANHAAIAAALEGMRSVSGRLTGHLILRGAGAPIAETVDVDCGYPNINSTNAYGPERLTLTTDGSVTFPAGVGVGFHIHAGFGTTVDVAIQGGGEWGDVAVLVEDHQNLWLSVQGAMFAGTLLKADADGDNSKRVRTSNVARVSATSCGQAIYWRAIEAFGEFGHIYDNNSVHGSQFIACSDTKIGLYESYSPATQTYGLDFDGCNAFQVDAITLGDAAATLLRIKGGDFGRIGRIRTSGRPGIAVPVENGVLLEDVASLDVDTLTTFRCNVGLEVRGGGFGGIRIKQHRSMTTDRTPLLLTAGTSTAPKLTIGVDYRMTAKSIEVGPGITGGWLALSGRIRDFHLEAPSGSYALTVDPTSGSLSVDVAGLTQMLRGGGLAGFTNHPTPANITGVGRARIENPLTHGTAPAALALTLGTGWRNANPRTAVVVLAMRFNPAVGSNAGATYRVGPTDSPPVVADDNLVGDPTIDVTEHREVRTFIVPPYWYLSASATGGGASLATALVYYL